MRRRRFLATSLGSIAAVAGCLGLGDSNRALPDDPTGQWHQYAYDSRKSGASDVTVPERGNRAWNAGDAQSVEPVVTDGLVFSVNDGVTALDAKTGEQQWEQELPGSAEVTPTIADEQLLVAAEDRLVSFDCADGSEQWAKSLPLFANDALATDGSCVVVPLEARRDGAGLVAYDVGDGEQLWTDRTVAAGTAAIHEDVVYVTGYKQDGDTGILRALSAVDGSRMWEVELGHPDASPVATGDGILVCDSGVLAVHERDDGERVRQLGTFGDRIHDPPVVADGLAFIGSGEPAIVAVSIDDGSTAWTSNGGLAARPSLGRETLVISAESLPEESAAGVAALDYTTGELQWEYPLEGFDVSPSTAPVLADGAVYVVSNESSGVSALGDLPA
ncbi:MAG: PQQ-binding-like beta-propeller repeat protein, partial [Halapricum sp.]